MKHEKLTWSNLWLVILCLLASAFLPSVARAQVGFRSREGRKHGSVFCESVGGDRR